MRRNGKRKKDRFKKLTLKLKFRRRLSKKHKLPIKLPLKNNKNSKLR
jgi:hypothetical protein